MTPPTYKYHAFISYSHTDRVWANWLHRALETYRVPKRLVAAGAPARLSPIFRDREELPSANNLGQKIEEALLASRCFIVICSPRAAQSRWVNEEIARFEAMGRGDQTYCLIVDGEPPDCFPPALLAGDGAEPIAADVRDGGDGKNQAKLKIIAGMLGVGLDELRQRDLQRRNRRLVWFSTASIAGVLITTALAAFAWIARNEAEASRQRAEREAETARQTTKFMVGLFDVVDPGEAKGRSVTAYEILEKGVANIHRDLDTQPQVQATLLQTMGKVFAGLGLYQRSVELLKEAFGTRGAIVTVDTAETQIALSDALYLKGDYDEAEQGYRETLKVLSSLPWDENRSGAANGLADVLTQKNDLDSAIVLYQQTLDQDIAKWGVLDVHTARTSSGLATAQLYAGDAAAADISFRRTLDAYRAVLGPDDPKVVDTMNSLAAVRHYIGDQAGAMQYYHDALPLFRKLYGNVHPNVSTVLNNYGRLELEQSHIAAALPLLKESVEIDRQLGRAEHDDFVFSLSNLALAYRASGDSASAKPLLDEAAALAARHDHSMWGPILADQADLSCSAGRTDGATALLDNAAQHVQASFPDQPWRMAVVDSERGQCLSVAGDREAGERLLLSSLPIIEAKWGKSGLFTHDARARIAEHYVRSGNPALAQRYRAG